MRLLLLFCLLVSSTAFAEGEQVMGTNPCPFGMTLITFSVGERVVASVCIAPAEIERATYSKGPDEGNVACRVMRVRGKQ